MVNNEQGWADGSMAQGVEPRGEELAILIVKGKYMILGGDGV